MQNVSYSTKEEVLNKAKEAIGIPLRCIDKTNRLSTGKGSIGNVIEESWFGISPNPSSEPDFPQAGVELKVTPYIRTRVGIRAKERLVCNIINYMEEFDKTFKTSSFWHKCSSLLLLFYEHLKNIPKGDYKIDYAFLNSFPEEDLIIIEQDWEKIIEKVRSGKAHEISEGDTLYLGACTKGATSASTREQPFSKIPAKQRAYSLKLSYMTQILNRYIFGKDADPKIIQDWTLLQQTSFEEYISKKVRVYYGKTQDELKQLLNVKSDSKNVNELLLAKMLGVTGRISNTQEFKKARIIPKTIRVQKNGKVRESMSFPTFNFIKLSEEKEWEESDFYNYLEPTKFMFVVFQERDDGQYVFDKVKFWNIPNDDLEEVGEVWKRTVETIRAGVILTPRLNKTINNLPKASENKVAHVRPHAKDSKDVLPLPDGRMMTKQCFWLNNTYIAEQIKV